MTAVRRHDAEASRTAILDAAQRLFLERGFAGTSMSEVAKASGVTKSLIHHHFGSKEALWESVKRKRFAAYYDQQVKLLTRRPLTPEIARESMRMYFEYLRDNPQVLRLMWWMLLENDDSNDEMITEMGVLGVEQIAALQEAKVIREDVSPQSILMGFLGLVHAGFTEGWVRESSPMSVDDYIDEAWKIFARGVGIED